MNKLHITIKKIILFVAFFALLFTEVGAYSTSFVSAKTRSINVVSVRLPIKLIVLNKKTTYQLSPWVTPNYATNKKLKYKSSKKSVASINSKGKITAKRNGITTITISSVSNPSARCTLKVKVGRRITDLTLNATSKIISVRHYFMLKGYISPRNASYKKLKFISSDPTVASVSKKGKVTAKGVGSAYITVQATDGSNIKRQCYIQVIPRRSANDSTHISKVEKVVKNTSTTQASKPKKKKKALELPN